jgi:rhamnose utilization protein RhaD (predicted bifunctional aldolase and dehydrogenase)/NAD(P)-dependent dehydrogenase (short-subunit alcohol dehydrogenase family)
MASTETSQQQLLDALVAVSRKYGSDPDFVLAGGGNTSAKMGQRLWVKGSGAALASISVEGFVEMDRPALETLLSSDLGGDRTVREERFKQAVLAARVDPQKGQRPSVEVVLHHLMPRRLVVHSHSTVVNMFTCSVRGEAQIRDLCGDQVLWIADVDPGLVLAQTLRNGLKEYAGRSGRDCPRAVIMQNHGLVVAGDTPEEIRDHTDWLIGLLRGKIASLGTGDAFGPVAPVDAKQGRELVDVIGPALRGLLATEDGLRIATFDDGAEVMSLVAGREGRVAAEGGPLTPDQIVYCKSLPLWVEVGDRAVEAVVNQLRRAVADYRKQTRFLPQVILVKGLGMFTAGDDYAAAHTTRLVYIDAIKVMAGACKLGGIRPLRPGQREFFENWEVEAYRRKIARGTARAGRAAGKVAIVTGAAQGFGLEIAQDLAVQGAHVVLADINAGGAAQAADAIVAGCGTGRAMGVAINVTDGQSVEQAIHQAVRTYGGCDLFISNAGVLKAASVKTLPEKDFDFVTSVNYKGYFVCVQKVSPVLAVQHKARPDSWSDIIQINSKSGLQGSNRNGAYAGSKFGGIGLTQSFAMELVEDGIKVNAICPGNFFDGPLWSNPDSGLFVQYLRSGKVPGAKTVEEVKRFYEAKVPMGRGCTTADVMKAVYYLMDQKYETGQAVPVTGGQVMLS